MSRYKLIVAYDGTDYHGWQYQQGLPSITQELQDSFFRVFKKKIIILGASRTDAGVHALGQTAIFNTDFVIDSQRLKFAWNNSLPSSITIRSIECNDAFNPFENVVQKTYGYHFFTQRPLPMYHRFGWHVDPNIDLKKLNTLLQIFIGTHDFRSFCTGTDDELPRGTIRTIDSIDLEYLPRFKAHKITVKGQKFLRHMIRRIVGACIVGAARPDITKEHICAMLNAKNPAQTLPNAPAKGLMLYRIEYKPYNGRDIESL